MKGKKEKNLPDAVFAVFASLPGRIICGS
jgi:hypothetical protein